MGKRTIILLVFLYYFTNAIAQHSRSIPVTGYFAGRASALDSFPIGKLNYLVFSFCHLDENKMKVSNAADSTCIHKMVSLKKKYPGLKIILSMGGWGGCQPCSQVFSLDTGRNEFAHSVKLLLEYFHADGFDLDWEYPAIEGFPGHPYSPGDKNNFTLLMHALRNALGKKYEISFAAGGFDYFINNSIDWPAVMQVADKVNLMSYDLVHGASRISGHHTPLYSTPGQILSTDHAVNLLIAAGVPPQKIVIGAAFYARMFRLTDTANHGLYDSCSFYQGISYSHLMDTLTPGNGFVQYWDPVADAPYAFNADRKLLVTYDDSTSVTKKVNYVYHKKLGGIMFWQLMDDRFSGGLLEMMDRAKKTIMHSRKTE
jgi:chitinase